MILWLLACAPRPVPAHLIPDPAPPSVVYEGAAAVVAAGLQGDPLARRPLPDGHTPAPVAFARGRALAEVEGALRTPGRIGSARALAAAWPVDIPTTPPEHWPRDPADWAAGPEAIRHAAEHRVLVGWLAGPGIPLEPVVAALHQPQYDDVRARPAARLLEARAAGLGCEAATRDQGLADLRQATQLALWRAAADSDREQRAFGAEKQAVATALGVTDPVAALLATAAEGLTGCADDDLAVGGAWMAIEAARWFDTCPDRPCAGLDRVTAIADAARWDPSLVSLAAVWRVTALKESLDTLDAGRSTVIFSDGMPLLADALLGSGTARIDAWVLLADAPTPPAWRAVGRALDVDATTWEEVRPSLVERLRSAVSDALAADPEPALRDLLDRPPLAPERP